MRFVFRNPLSAILLFGFIAFGATLKVGFLWDDHEMIVKNPWVQNINAQTLKHALTSDVFNGKGNSYYRPMQTFLNMWDFRVWGLHPFGFHLTNLLFHLLSAVLLFGLFRFVLGDEKIALLSALLFVAHPIVVEQLLIIAGRAELMSMAFGLSFLFLALRRSWPAAIFGGTLFIFSLLSKESGVAFFLFLPLFSIVNPQLKLPARHYLFYAGLLVAYFLFRLWVFPFEAGIFLPSHFIGVAVRDFPVIFFDYLRILIFPVDLHSHRRLVLSAGMMGISYVAVVLAAILFWVRRSKFDIFCVAWFFLGLAPKFGLLASNALMLDHWAYMSAVAVCLWVGKELLRLRQSRPTFAAVLGSVILVFWISMAWVNIFGRNTDKRMYLWALKYPSSSIVRANLGQIYYLEENFEEAERLFRQSLQIEPASPMTSNHLALVYWKTGRKDEALALLNRIIGENPRYLQSYVNRAVINRGSSGLEDLTFVLADDPNYEAAWALAGSIFVEQNRLDEALLAYGEVVRINARNVQALVDLGTLHGLQGRFEEAGKLWAQALRFDPNNEVARKNLVWLTKKTQAEP